LKLHDIFGGRLKFVFFSVVLFLIIPVYNVWVIDGVSQKHVICRCTSNFSGNQVAANCKLIRQRIRIKKEKCVWMPAAKKVKQEISVRSGLNELQAKLGTSTTALTLVVFFLMETGWMVCGE
jgi:hypothetical protein